MLFLVYTDAQGYVFDWDWSLQIPKTRLNQVALRNGSHVFSPQSICHLDHLLSVLLQGVKMGYSVSG